MRLPNNTYTHLHKSVNWQMACCVNKECFLTNAQPSIAMAIFADAASMSLCAELACTKMNGKLLTNISTCSNNNQKIAHVISVRYEESPSSNVR